MLELKDGQVVLMCEAAAKYWRNVKHHYGLTPPILCQALSVVSGRKPESFIKEVIKECGWQWCSDVKCVVTSSTELWNHGYCDRTDAAVAAESQFRALLKKGLYCRLHRKEWTGGDNKYAKGQLSPLVKAMRAVIGEH